MVEVQARELRETPGRDVFISYASPDKAVADAVCAALEAAGVACWIAPRDVTPGEFYAESIVHALDSSKVIALVLSQHATDSNHVLREVERASSKRHPVVSFRIDVAPLPAGLEYFLNTSQWLDASVTGVDRALPRLIDAVKSALAQPPATVRAEPTASIPAKASSRRNGLLIASAVFVTGAIAYVAVSKYWLVKRATGVAEVRVVVATAAIHDKSIAVLPFADMSEKHDQEYFSDGLTEELIDHLAHNPGLKVIARTSSFAFKGKNEDMTSIAAKLRVANLLEGSVRKAGEELRVTAQLIRASDGVHLWSEIYDRKFADIFKVQDEISTTVAKALNAALNMTPASGGQPAANGSTNIEAYKLLLQGKYFYDRQNMGDTARAVEHYQQALNLDPHYALAWAKLARAYAYQGSTGELTAADAEAKGREAAERALVIDPNCAEAYYARGQLFRFIDGDWTAAKSDFERSVMMDPHGEVGEHAQSNIFDSEIALSGRFGDSIDWQHRSLERDPLNFDALWVLASTQQFAGHLEDSAATSRRLLELNPSYATAQALYAETLLLMGKDTEALAAAEQEPDEAWRLQTLACIYWALGRRADSDSALGALERRYSDRKAYEIAGAHAYRGEANPAFAWLERAHQKRRGSLEFLKVDPLFSKVHGDPRFNVFLRKAKLSA